MVKDSKLCILVGTLGGGGAERLAVNIVEYLSEKYSVFLTILIKIKAEKYITKIRSRYLIKRLSTPLMLFFGLPIIVIRYVLMLISERPKTVLSILYLDNIINMCISPFFKVKPIISIHDIHSHTFKSKPHLLLFIPFEMYLLKHMKVKAIAVSNGVKNDLIMNFGISPDKIRVIYNPININAIRELSSEDIPNGIIKIGIPTIITTGRLTAVKSQWHLIRAFAAICKEQSARLLICGIGEEEFYLKSLVNDLGINESVIFLGWQDNPYKYMARSTVFVLSSLSEALPNVLIEAMATGCPVISSNCSAGVREILGENGEYGLLTKPMTGIRHDVNDVLDSGEESIYLAIQKILKNRDLRNQYGEIGLKRASFFSEDVRMKEYEAYTLDN